MNGLIVSPVTGKVYDPSKCCRILNLKQVEAYMANGCAPLDFYIKNGKCIFVFSRDQTSELYDKWCRYELPIPSREE